MAKISKEYINALYRVCSGFDLKNQHSVSLKLKTISNLINNNFISSWNLKKIKKIELKVGKGNGPADEYFMNLEFDKITQAVVKDLIIGQRTFRDLINRDTLKIVVNRNIIDALNETGDLWMVIRDFTRHIDKDIDKDFTDYFGYISSKGVVFKELLSKKLYREVIAGITMISTSAVKISKKASLDAKLKREIRYDGLANDKWGKAVAIDSLKLIEKGLGDKALKESVINSRKMISEAFRGYSWNDNITELQYLSEGVTALYNDELKDDIKYISREFIRESVESNHIFQERFAVKKLKKLSMEIIGYVLVNGETMKDGNDKMLIIGYAYSKLDIADFYIELIDTGSKRYVVPHTKEYLVNFRTKLLEAIDKVMNTKLPKTGSVINVEYPKGYEG